MNKLTFSLNYRKPKSEYKTSEELMICIRYYHKDPDSSKAKIIKKSTGVKCKLKDWDTDWHKNSNRFPVKPSDPDHEKKNMLLIEKVEAFRIQELPIQDLKTDFSTILNSKVPDGDLKNKWTTYKDKINLVNPANKRNIDVIVVGTGLAGGSASATLAELGLSLIHISEPTRH